MVLAPPVRFIYRNRPMDYCVPLEDSSMTFQIGLVGNDRVVLASDKRCRDSNGGVATTFETGKIVVDHAALSPIRKLGFAPWQLPIAAPLA